MSEKIKDILKKTAKHISKTSSSNSPNTNFAEHSGPGDPNCELCGGMGYLRRDVPMGHPDFGKLFICKCRQTEIQQKRRDRLFRLSNLDELKHLTFENFEYSGRIGLGIAQAKSLEMAYNTARQFAQTLEGWLLLQGRYGCGKTHLAAAVANFVVDLGVSTIFITVPDLLDNLRFTYDDPNTPFSQRFEDIRQAQLLVMDDFGTHNATPWAQEKLFQIINYRYINSLPLLVTTNLALDQIEGRIRSRLQDPELVSRMQILAPDYRRPADDTGHPELSSLGLLADLTFGNFSLRKGEGLDKDKLKSLEKAFQSAKTFAERPKGWLTFTGTYGCGKTHLAAAIANYRAGLGTPPLFIMVPDLLDHLRATFNPKSETSYDRLFNQIKTTNLLILDDLGTESMTPWVKEKLYQLFNYRYNAKLPTVITTATPLGEIDPRIRSRMMDKRISKVHTIFVPTFMG
ncbi:MAG: DNA replication protein DnaC [Chloroflexota bacterium]|nr:MAG: DNA replication protein DnaC [Chloroflexota bacterium]